MLAIILILTATNIGVYCQRYAAPLYQTCPSQCNPLIVTRGPYEYPIPCEGAYLPQTIMPTMPKTDTTTYVKQVVPEIPMPVACTVEKRMPVIPFITELPSCPDICLTDILTSPLGCLDPILTLYSTKAVCPLPELPVSPLLPASIVSPTFSRLLPPVSECCYSNCLKRAPIPPPFI